jgi:hypothetical protein
LNVFSHLNWIFPDLTPIHDKDEECEKEEEEPEDDLKDGENASLFKNKKVLKNEKNSNTIHFRGNIVHVTVWRQNAEQSDFLTKYQRSGNNNQITCS